jgi:nitrous oxide reductase accessory protein NosL
MLIRSAFVLLLVASVALIACEQKADTPPVKPAAAASSADGYPLDVCLVSDEPLGSMGDPVVMEHNGRQVKFCCAGCVESFNKEPARYMAKLDSAKGGASHDDHDDHTGHNH